MMMFNASTNNNKCDGLINPNQGLLYVMLQALTKDEKCKP